VAHVLGNEIQINTANVVTADILARNGVIHTVDAVLVPGNFSLPADDIVTTAASAPQLTTLVTAIKAANLTAALSAPSGPYTVFAPTDAAFAALPPTVLNFLLNHPAQLAAVLEYHVVNTRYYSTQLVQISALPTLDKDEEITFMVNGAALEINGVAFVVSPNIQCQNGVVHTINAGERAGAHALTTPNALTPTPLSLSSRCSSVQCCCRRASWSA